MAEGPDRFRTTKGGRRRGTCLRRRFRILDELIRYAAELEDVVGRGPAPVEQWSPARTGAIDIVIRRDGVWIHEGAPIRRARLVQLFATILKREGDDYFLVTPAEKLKITVEDAPFLAVRMDRDGTGQTQRIRFTSNVGERVVAGPDHALVMQAKGAGETALPYIHVRGGLMARLARPVFYELADLIETRQTEQGEVPGVWSSGEFFPLTPEEDECGKREQ